MVSTILAFWGLVLIWYSSSFLTALGIWFVGASIVYYLKYES